MYRGSKGQTIKLPHTKWKYVNEDQGGMKWQIEGEWAVTSFQMCKRVFQYPLKEFGEGKKGKINVVFKSTVKGTGPNFADFYVILRNNLECGGESNFKWECLLLKGNRTKKYFLKRIAHSYQCFC